MRFATSRDPWESRLRGGGRMLAVGAGAGLVVTALAGEAPPWSLLAGPSLIAFAAISHWFDRAQCYEITSEALYLRNGLPGRRIPLGSIEEAVQLKGPHDQFAADRRVEVRYRWHGRTRKVQITPCDRVSFLQRLATADAGFLEADGRVYREPAPEGSD